MVKLHMTDRNGERVEVDASPGLSVMENIRDLPASVEAICGGMCSCATCHILVEPDSAGQVSPRSWEELQMLQGDPNFDSHRSRLSCQIRVTDQMDGFSFTVVPEEL
jgi:ferredoxin, 2Fe-2S